MKTGYIWTAPHSDPLKPALQQLCAPLLPISKVEMCDQVFTGFPDDRARAEYLLSLEVGQSLAPGAIIVDQTDADPDRTRDLAAALKARGVVFVALHLLGQFRADTGVPEVILAGGETDVPERIRPILAETGAQVFLQDSAEQADAMHLLLSSLGLSTRIATLGVVGMGSKFGLDLSTMADLIGKGSGRNRTSNTVLPRRAAGLSSSDMTLGRAARLLHLAQTVGQRDGAALLTTGLAAGLARAAANRNGEESTLDTFEPLSDGTAGSGITALPDTQTAPATGAPKGLRVGYVGVGTMGGAIVRRLLQSRSVTVFDMNPAAMQALEDIGAQTAPDLPTLARSCDVIFTCLPKSEHVRHAIFGPNGLAEGLSRGKLLVDQTTGNPGETLAISAELKTLGVDMVDAPVSGGTRGADAGTLAIICGGPGPAFATVRPILAELSPNIVYCGPVGNGHAGKLVQNAVAACNRVITLECVAAACKRGLTLTGMIDPVNTGAAWNGGAERIIPALRTGTATTRFAVGLMVKDVRTAMEIGNALDAPMPIAYVALSLFQACSNEYGSDSNLDKIADVIESMSGLRFADHA